MMAMVGVGVLVVLLAGSVLDLVQAKPCPEGSVFVFSEAHSQPMCACDPKAHCAGDPCTSGSSTNLPAFSSGIKGFPINCPRCSCYFLGSAEASVINAAGKPVTDDSGKVLFYDHPDPEFDSHCEVNASVQPPTPKALERISWVHIPKCASSVTSLIYNYACRDFDSAVLYEPDKYGSLKKNRTFKTYTKRTCDTCYETCRKRGCSLFTTWAPHSGLMREEGIVREKQCTSVVVGSIPGHKPLDFHPHMHGTYVGTFRDPRRRLLSAFNYHRHAYGMKKEQQEKLIHVHTLEDFAAFNGIAHCQVKHLNGIRCAEQNTRIGLSDAVVAVERFLTSFAFGGLTDYYSLSVCLFHRMYGGKIHPDEMANLRPGEDFLAKYEEMGYNILPKSAWRALAVRHEPYDWLLYTVVLDTFYRRVREYGLVVPPQLQEEHGNVFKWCGPWIEAARTRDKQAYRTGARQCLAYEEPEADKAEAAKQHQAA